VGCPTWHDGQPGQALAGINAGAFQPRGSLPRFLVVRCTFVNTLARSPGTMVLRMDGRNRTCNHWFWRPALSLVELRPYVTQMKTARRACPLRAASGRCLRLYPEATSVIRAVPSSNDAAMPTCRSSRWWPDHAFTVRFLSRTLFMVRAHPDWRQRYFRLDCSGREGSGRPCGMGRVLA
jgi:hypothetical protein